MRIDTLRVKNFKGMLDRALEFHPEFNLIVGTNGTGKTSMLDAVAVAAGSWFLGLRGYDTRHILSSEVCLAAHDFNGEIRFEAQYPVEVCATGLVAGKDLEWKRSLDSAGGKTRFMHAANVKALAAEADKQVRSGEEVTLPLISYYGTGRLWQEPRALSQVKNPERLVGKSELSRLEGYRNSVDPRLSVRDLTLWLARQSWIGYQQGKETPTYSAVRQAILTCVEGARNLYFDPKRGEVIIVMEYHGAQPFFNLSDGQRCMVAMVGDIAQKAAKLNPHLGENSLRETPGIVLVDELDLHLHPRWQRHMIEDLRKTFPKLQFICTTHSPFLIQSLRSGEELITLDGQPPAELANRPIDEIARGVMRAGPEGDAKEGQHKPEVGLNSIGEITREVMGVAQTEVADRYDEMKGVAKSYLAQLDEAPLSDNDKLEAFKNRLAESIAPYADNPAYQAFLELKRAAKLKEKE